MRDFFTSETGITVAGALLGALWALFKSTELYGRIRRRRYREAVDALETAVEETYRTYVQAIKNSRPDGKLLPGEKRRARQIAQERAAVIGQARGVNVARVIGPDRLDLVTARTVNRLKRA